MSKVSLFRQIDGKAYRVFLDGATVWIERRNGAAWSQVGYGRWDPNTQAIRLTDDLGVLDHVTHALTCALRQELDEDPAQVLRRAGFTR